MSTKSAETQSSKGEKSKKKGGRSIVGFCTYFVLILAIAAGAFFNLHPSGAKYWVFGRVIVDETIQQTKTFRPIHKITDIWSPEEVATLMDICRKNPMDSFIVTDQAFGMAPNPDGFTCPHPWLKLDMCRPPVCEVPTKRCVVPVVTKLRGSGVNASDTEINKRLRSGSLRYMMRLYLVGDPLEGDNVVNFQEAIPLLHNKKLWEGAKVLYPEMAKLIPRLLYINVVLPGQEVGMHLDVPTFRGLNRLDFDTKFLSAVRQSELFEDYRVKIATGVTYISNTTRKDSEGGAFSFFPNGPFAPRVDLAPDFNTGVVLDTDSSYHRVPTCQPQNKSNHIPPFHPMFTFLVWNQKINKWQLKENDTVIKEYDDDDLRISLSWKAYLFEDDNQYKLWEDKQKNLTVPMVLDGWRDNYIKNGYIGQETGVEDFLFILAARGVWRWILHHLRYWQNFWHFITTGALFEFAR